MIKATMKRWPGLHRTVQTARRDLVRLGCGGTERFISLHKAYRIVVLLGMRRSGNHLIINWMRNQTRGSTAFYNNIRPTADPLSAVIREFRVAFPNPSPTIFLSYEDLTPEEMLAGPLADFLADRVARHGARLTFCIILRDPYNLFASRLKKWPERFGTESDIARQRELYQIHARLARAPHPLYRDAPLVPILYNRVISDPAYRTGLARQLGIDDGDKGLQEVPAYGHGSSFDGFQTSGSTVQAGVFDRWRGSIDDARFVSAVTHPDIQLLTQELFGSLMPQLPPP